jgi:predicted transcriptional regulator
MSSENFFGHSADRRFKEEEEKSNVYEFFKFFAETIIRIPFSSELGKMFHGDLEQLIKLTEYIAVTATTERPTFEDDYGHENIVALPHDFMFALYHIITTARNKPNNLYRLLGLTNITKRRAEMIYDIISENESVNSGTLAMKARIAERNARNWLARFMKQGWLAINTRDRSGIIYELAENFGIYEIELDLDKLANITEIWLEKHYLDQSFRRDYIQSKVLVKIMVIPHISIEGFPDALFR